METTTSPASAELAIGPPTTASGHVVSVSVHVGADFTGCSAFVKEKPTTKLDAGTTLLVYTPDFHFQSLLETALSTGKLMSFNGTRVQKPPVPLGGGVLPSFQLDRLTVTNKT